MYCRLSLVIYRHTNTYRFGQVIRGTRLTLQICSGDEDMMRICGLLSYGHFLSLFLFFSVDPCNYSCVERVQSVS